MTQLRDAPQPCGWGHIDQAATLPCCLSLPGTRSTEQPFHGHALAPLKKGGANENQHMCLCKCVSDELYGNTWWLFLKARSFSVYPSGNHCLFIWISFQTIPILSVILSPFHIKSNNAKKTALMNSKTWPKDVPFTTTTCWINDIHHSVDRPEKDSSMPAT